MKISILGANGFIGKHLTDSLSKVYAVKSISLRKEDWASTIADTNVFINLIGKAHDHKGTATENDYYYANVNLVKDIYQVFIRSNANLLIHISSLAALEEFASSKHLLETDDCHPQSFYGKSKRQAEEWLLSQPLSPNKKIIIIRPPMVHGPGDKGNLGLLYKMISKGIPYPLSSFDNFRSFISIDNFSFFVKKIIEKQNSIPSGIYHIADDESVSTKQIIDIIKKSENKNIINLNIPKSLIRTLAKVGDVLRLPLNTKRLSKMTSNLEVSNCKIKTILEIEKLPLTAKEGLQITINAFRQEKKSK